MRICLFEDGGVGNLEPLTLTRPAFELLCGPSSLGHKQCQHFAPGELGVLVRPELVDLCRLQHPGLPVNDLAWLRAAPTVLVNGRWLPPAAAGEAPAAGVALAGDEVAYAVLNPDRLTYCSPNTLLDCLETWTRTLPRHPAGGRLIAYPWDLVQANADQLAAEFPHGGRPGRPKGGPELVGPARHLAIDPTARLDPLVVVDTTAGPVVIDQEAVVAAFSRIEGPCYVGPRSHVLGAKLRAGTTLGPDCRVGGEVEASILHGRSNKYHDGFLGHSYVGEWVNLGAGTQTSDLRNDYGEVAVPVRGRPVPTGLTKVGSFIGDHTKTSLGTLLNTGTSVGAFCNLLPGGLLPKHVPSFTSWWNERLREAGDVAAVLQTAAIVMERRGQHLTAAHAALYRRIFEQTTAERERAMAASTQRALRRSA